MPVQAGGSARFGGPGSQWKTSWKGKAPFSEICCISGFSNAFGSNYYEDAAALPGSTVTGFFVGAVVGLQAVPVGADTIAENSGVANEGWTLDMVAGALPGSVAFRFTVYDGAGIAAQVQSFDVSLANVATGLGLPDALFVSVLAGLITGPNSPPDGAAFVAVAQSTSASTPVIGALVAPYVNAAPSLRVGVGGFGTDFSAPNCIQGIVGGTAPWGGTPAIVEIFDAWNAANQDTSVSPTQIQPLPDAVVPIGVVNTNGWRSPTTPGASPDPLLPFIGAVDLTYALDPNFPLAVARHSPAVFWPANVLFPFA